MRRTLLRFLFFRPTGALLPMRCVGPGRKTKSHMFRRIVRTICGKLLKLSYRTSWKFDRSSIYITKPRFSPFGGRSLRSSGDARTWRTEKERTAVLKIKINVVTSLRRPSESTDGVSGPNGKSARNQPCLLPFKEGQRRLHGSVWQSQKAGSRIFRDYT